MNENILEKAAKIDEFAAELESIGREISFLLDDDFILPVPLPSGRTVVRGAVRDVDIRTIRERAGRLREISGSILTDVVV